jgi:hypothetical protein
MPMRRPGSLAAFGMAALALALAGCGSSGPKRTVDARAEALRFFPADAPLVALVDTSPTLLPAREALAADVAGLTPWEAIRSQFLARLSTARIPVAGLDSLLRDQGEEPADGLPASQLAVGLSPGPGLARSKTFVVLVTDRPEAMDQMFAHSVAAGGLRPAGSDDEAHIYSSRDSAFAVRDGVMLAAQTPAELRAAIDLRDGDRDAQLDDGEVKSLLAKLPGDAPLEAYADMAQLRRRDPAAAALANSEPWTRRLGKAAASVTARPAGPVLDLFSEIEPAAGDGAVLPDEEGRASFEVSVAELRDALSGEFADSSRLGRLSIAAAPLAAAVTVTGDELRAKIVLSP